MALTPFIIPFFISHQGCPHQCVFCNQHVITGSQGQSWLTAGQVKNEIDRCLAWPRDRKRPVQVAFYGGSFTGIDRERQEELLGAVRSFLQSGAVDLIRLSTRPDYIDEQSALFLKEHGVGIVELGIQSFDEEVLALCRRGHSAEQVEKAFLCLRQVNIGVGGQLMVGLPGETTCQVVSGARRLAALKPDLVRIYPTLVLCGSPLSDLWRAGNYQPLSLARAVALCGYMKIIFDQKKIPVVRMGLQGSASLERDLLAGPYHQAFGELVMSRIYFKRLRTFLSILQNKRESGMKKIILSSADQSLLHGQKRCSLNRLTRLGLLEGMELVFQAGLPRFTMTHETII